MTVTLFASSLQANATGRNAKTVREFLEKYYTTDEVKIEKGAVKLAIRALLEVVQSGQRNLEIAVMGRDRPLKVSHCLFQNPYVDRILMLCNLKF